MAHADVPRIFSAVSRSVALISPSIETAITAGPTPAPAYTNPCVTNIAPTDPVDHSAVNSPRPRNNPPIHAVTLYPARLITRDTNIPVRGGK